MKHTYILMPSRWLLNGYLFTSNEKIKISVTGQCNIEHMPDKWMLTNALLLSSDDDSTDVTHYYDIEPTPNLARFNIHRITPDKEALYGTMTLVDETQIQVLHNHDHSCNVVEIRILQPDGQYELRGRMIQKNELISTWIYNLQRIKA